MKWLLLISLAVAACGGASPASAPPKPTAYVSGPGATTDLFDNAEIKVTADQAGVSQTFRVTSGSYHLSVLNAFYPVQSRRGRSERAA